jgi:hypothetical protein
VLNGVCVGWAGALEEPLEVVHGWPCLMPVAPCGGRDATHTGATHLLDIAVIIVGHGCAPLKVLLVPLLATLDVLLATMDHDIG